MLARRSILQKDLVSPQTQRDPFWSSVFVWHQKQLWFAPKWETRFLMPAYLGRVAGPCAACARTRDGAGEQRSAGRAVCVQELCRTEEP